MSELERAVGVFMFIKGGHTEDPNKYMKLSEAVSIAITALQEKLEREKGCGFCNEEYSVMSGSRMTEDEKHCGCTAAYCPMCGKQLKGCGD